MAGSTISKWTSRLGRCRFRSARLSRQGQSWKSHGSGSIRAKGKIDDLKIEIAGSGRADFGQVAASNARVEIGGHGDVDIAPSEEAKIEIGGSGDVYLHTNPKSWTPRSADRAGFTRSIRAADLDKNGGRGYVPPPCPPASKSVTSPFPAGC